MRPNHFEHGINQKPEGPLEPKLNSVSMKKLALLTLLSTLVSVSVRADVIWQEPFAYTNGNIEVTSTNVVGGVLVTNWIRHSGSGNDAYVTNQTLQVSATGGTISRQDDIHRNFPAAYTNSAIPVYYSFIINCTGLPNAAGTYFAHIQNQATSFQGKLFALVGTNLCLPNTFRLGAAGAANNASVIFPTDLALNQNYQVVVEWDPVLLFATTIWVNPLSSSDVNLISSDTVSTPGIAASLSFRQASSFGNFYCTVSNLVVATTFDEAATNVLASNSVPPSIAYDLKSITNFVAVPSRLSVVAAGQGQADFAYLWQKDGVDFSNPNGNSNVLSFASPVLGDTGQYGVVVSNTLTGAKISSSTVLMWVTNGPPQITLEPTNQGVFPGKTVTISVAAVGTPTLYYSWSYNNGAPTNADPATTNTPNLVIDNVQTNNGTLGKYSCLITNDYGSTNSFTNTLSLLTPQTVTIDTLRGAVDSTFFLPTNTSVYYTVSNAVVYTLEVTNLDGSVNGGVFTASPNGEFFIQDGTGGIAVFVSGGASIQPRQGDIVNITGPLGNFNSLLQFNLSASDPSHIVTIVGHTNTLPTPTVLPFTFTNGAAPFISVSNVIRKYEGKLVTLTNCYFAAYAPGATFVSGNYILTNLAGNTFTMFLNSANSHLIGQPIPPFAWTITGPMGYFNSTTAVNRSGGFELDPSSYADIVVGPPAPTGTIGVSANSGPATVTWNAQPYVGYSVLWSTNVAGPYMLVASNLTFSSASGSFTDTVNTNLPASFYKITSP
jgi:hypothetical protein